jgi:hypothetical protein
MSFTTSERQRCNYGIGLTARRPSGKDTARERVRRESRVDGRLSNYRVKAEAGVRGLRAGGVSGTGLPARHFAHGCGHPPVARLGVVAGTDRATPEILAMGGSPSPSAKTSTQLARLHGSAARAQN